MFASTLIKKKSGSIIDNLQLQPKHYGKENKDKIIYYICEDNGNLGFFALYRYWVEYLYFADVCGYCPVISAGKEFAYGEEKRILGTRNPYEYYFCQPSGIGLQQVRSSYKVIYSHISHRQIVEIVYTGKNDNYLYTQRYLQTMADIVKKYVKFNDNTMQFLKDGLDAIDLSNKSVLGVHIRGTDFRMGYNNHPVYVTAEEYFDVIDKYLHSKKYDKIFIATDDSRILDQFIKRYGDLLCYYEDTIRNDKNVSVIFKKEVGKEYRYRAGLEVIRDMYTLASCDGLLAGISQVAICAQINKLAQGGWYNDLEIINKGIYKNGRSFRKRG